MKSLLKFAFFCLFFLSFSHVGFGQVDSLKWPIEGVVFHEGINWDNTKILEGEKTPGGRKYKLKENTTGNVFMYEIVYPKSPQDLGIYLQKNTKLPKDTMKEGVSGTAEVQFTISETGDVTEAQIIKSLHKSFDAEALRVVNSMPRWNPGKYNGKPVKVTMIIPFTINIR